MTPPTYLPNKMATIESVDSIFYVVESEEAAIFKSKSETHTCPLSFSHTHQQSLQTCFRNKAVTNIVSVKLMSTLL